MIYLIFYFYIIISLFPIPAKIIIFILHVLDRWCKAQIWFVLQQISMAYNMEISKNILLVSITLLVLVNSRCPTQYIFPYQVCTFNLTYTDPACFNFNFIACQHNGFQSVITSTSWQSCINLCCDTSIQYIQNQDSIQLCQSYILWNRTSYIILMSVIGFAFLVPTSIAIIYMATILYRKCKVRRQRRHP